MKAPTKIIIFLIAMALVDTVIPVPIAVFMLIYVFYQKPVWFKEMVLKDTLVKVHHQNKFSYNYHISFFNKSRVL